jgi:hypothetical protein
MIRFPFRNRLAAAVAAACLLSLATWGLVTGIAELAAVSPRLTMQRWEASLEPITAQSWNGARERLKLARRLNPLNADYSLDLARVHAWQAWLDAGDVHHGAAYRRQADRYYREALIKRPAWGLAWAQFAENRLLLVPADDRVMDALGHAFNHSPWEPGVQQAAAWLGMAIWGQLSEVLRGQVTGAVQRLVLMDTGVEQVVRAAVRHGRIDELRPLLKTEPHRALLRSVVEEEL